MDRNTILLLALSAALYFGWQASLDYRFPNRHDIAVPAGPRSGESEVHATGSPPAPGRPDARGVDSPLDIPAEQERQVVIERPLYVATFTTTGGALREWELRDYDDASQPNRPAVTITTHREQGSLNTPFLELGAGDLSALPYAVRKLNPDTIEFTTAAGSVRIKKVYRLDPNGYNASLAIEIENLGSSAVNPEFGVQWPAKRGLGADFEEYGLAAYASDEVTRFAVSPTPSALGFGGGSATETQEIKPDPKASEPFELDWAGAETRYFLAALMPDNPRDARARMTPIAPESEGLLDVWFEPVSLPPGAKLTREYRLYLGPKEPERLDALGAHLDEAVQRGWVPWLTRRFTAMLTFVHDYVPNYGLAILLLTIVIRVAMAPLMVPQMRSMKRMAEVMPKVTAAQAAAKARYPDDPTKQQEAMMAVYKQEGVNPLAMFGGCLPMLLQMPIFVGFYSALQGSIHLRQQPFFGWMTDLSQPESLFMIPGVDLHIRALPLLLGGAMVLQQRLTPTPNMDPAQARMMQIVMPVMMTLMFYQFASGLGLYWLMSTLLGIGQQLLMNRSKKPATA